MLFFLWCFQKMSLLPFIALPHPLCKLKVALDIEPLCIFHSDNHTHQWSSNKGTHRLILVICLVSLHPGEDCEPGPPSSSHWRLSALPPLALHSIRKKRMLKALLGMEQARQGIPMSLSISLPSRGCAPWSVGPALWTSNHSTAALSTFSSLPLWPRS